MTRAELERLEANRRRAASAAATATRKRNAAVVIALADGVPVRELAELLGLSPQRIRQIADAPEVGAGANVTR